MSNLNLEWLSTNLRPDAVIFDIGAADLYDTRNIKEKFPTAKIYAFECSNVWEHHNKQVADAYKINYYHMAISDVTGTLTFHPSNILDGKEWPWSGSICEPGPNLLNERWKWGDRYIVPSITLETFCIEHNVTPDFIHIDVQGAEYKVFSTIGNIRPNIVWAEISEFHLYNTGTTYEKFHTLMESLGYVEKFKDSCDALYVLNNLRVTEYEQKS